MAASSLRKLATTPSPPLRLLTSLLRDSSPSHLAAFLPSRPSSWCHFNRSETEPGKESRVDGLPGSIPFRVFYPCFPFAHHMNPVFVPGSFPSGYGDAADLGGETTVWADSVKKKRKKKMNKHKYKKLRKRLRRQT